MDDLDSENDAVQDNDDEIYDDNEYLPGEISLDGSEPKIINSNIDINNDNSSQEQINSLPDEITLF